MTKEEFATIVIKINQAYKDKEPVTEEGFEVWYELLSDLETRTLNEAAKNYIKENRYPPTIADLRTEYAKIKNRVNDINRQLRQIYDRTVGIYPNSTDDDETKKVWMNIIRCKPLEERIEYAEKLERFTSRYVRSVEDGNTEIVPTVTEFFRKVKAT